MTTTDLAVTSSVPRSRCPSSRSRDVATASLTGAFVAVLAALPLLRMWPFYFADDAATQLLPMWFHLGQHVLAGAWPPLLDLDSWMGGNLALEALFGVWNPVNVAIWVLVALVPDLAVAGVVIRMFGLVFLAVGCYVLAREYGAARWASSVVASAVPFCGSLFYFDVAKWPSTLLAFMWVPHVWWLARRMSRRRGTAAGVFVVGALAVTAGNPYAVLGVCVVFAGLLVENALLRQWRALGYVLGVSVGVGAVVPLVFLPLLLSSSVTWRAHPVTAFRGPLSPAPYDLINLGAPSFVPNVPWVNVPAVYYAWFVLPLAAWMHWDVVREKWRGLGGCWAVAGTFLLLAFGPAQVWMFRWPLRVLHYGYLSAAVLFAVVLSAGLRTDRPVRRITVTSALLLPGLVSTVGLPDTHRHMFSYATIAVLTAAAVTVYWARGVAPLSAVLHGGTAVTLGLQMWWFLGPLASLPYYFPSSVVQMRVNFDHRYQGTVVQIAEPARIGPPNQQREAWRDLLPGNLYLPAGVRSVNSYTGMGFRGFSDGLCMRYDGATCPAAYDVLWRNLPGTSAPLADVLHLDTVVVQRPLIDSPRPPDGWLVSERNNRVTVLRRQGSATASTSGRIGWSSPNMRVLKDTDPSDRVELTRFEKDTQRGRLVFARLAWPGYSADVNGIPVPVRSGPLGLLEVELPEEVHSGRLRVTWLPPGLRPGLASAAIGGAIALLLTARQCGSGFVTGKRRYTHVPH